MGGKRFSLEWLFVYSIYRWPKVKSKVIFVLLVLCVYGPRYYNWWKRVGDG